MAAGREAYPDAHAAYRLFGAAAKASLTGAEGLYYRLSERFAQQGPGGGTAVAKVYGTANKLIGPTIMVGPFFVL